MLHNVQHDGRSAVSSRKLGTALTAKERRERLFKKSKPHIRRLEIFDGEQYTKDMGILWAAYKAGSFNMPQNIEQLDFVREIENSISGFQHAWIIDDDCKEFSSGRGPVSMVLANTMNLVIEPTALFFKWATRKNILRASISFMHMIKHSSKTGIAMVRTSKEKRVLPEHLKKYDMLYYIGRSAENEYLYSIRGRGS